MDPKPEPAELTLQDMVDACNRLVPPRVSTIGAGSYGRLAGHIEHSYRSLTPIEVDALLAPPATLPPALVGIAVIEDPDLPLDQVEFRDKDGQVLARFTIPETP